MFKNIYEFSNAMTNNDPRNESCRPIQNERITFNSFEGGNDDRPWNFEVPYFQTNPVGMKQHFYCFRLFTGLNPTSQMAIWQCLVFHFLMDSRSSMIFHDLSIYSGGFLRKTIGFSRFFPMFYPFLPHIFLCFPASKTGAALPLRAQLLQQLCLGHLQHHGAVRVAPPGQRSHVTVYYHIFCHVYIYIYMCIVYIYI